MKITLLILAFLGCSISRTFSQTREHVKFVSTIKKEGYLFIPKDIFKDSNNAIIFQDLSLGKKVKRKDIDLHWTSECWDGTSYYLTITPQQIYLLSGHNNPNPNFLFWLINIDSVKYSKIRNQLISGNYKDFSLGYRRNKNDILNYYDTTYKDTLVSPETWTEEDQLKERNYCNNKFFTEITKIFFMINFYLPNDKITFPTLEEMNKIKPKYAAGSRSEIISWLPYLDNRK